MRKPSATLVVAAAALVMATIGTSVAATGYTITSSKQIKPGSISLESLSKSARKALRGERGPAGIAGEDGIDGAPGDDGLDGLDGQDGLDATNLWAQVKADGTINASSPGVTAIQTASAGVYDVNLGTDITHCAVIATQASIPDFSAAGQAIAGIPGPAFVASASAGATLAAGFPSLSSVTVQTRRTNGNPVSTSFSVAAFC
jgi:hypothetical protein